MKPPRFIVFEGIDGSGKSTQCDILHERLIRRGIPAVKLAEPSDGPWGRRIREMLCDSPMFPAEEQLRLFILDRRDDAEKNIIPALQRGEVVVMDRYYFSNAAYQGAAGIPPERIIQENLAQGFPEPDRIYLIDIDPASALQRIFGRISRPAELFETESFLAKVRDIYLSLADERFLIIDGGRRIMDIADAILQDFDAIAALSPGGHG